jgi:hypothetical protein
MERKYENSMESIETELQKAVGEKKKIVAAIEQEHIEFEIRRTEIERLKFEKRRKIAEKELLLLREVASTLIQAWWRGILVRKHLAAFKAFKKRAKSVKKNLREQRKKEKSSK